MELSNRDDTRLWLSFKNGDENAIIFIYNEYYPVLYRYGLKFSPQSALIEDVIQDFFTDLIKNRQTLGNTDNILFYLLKSFRRLLFRKLQQKSKYELSDKITDDYFFEVEWAADHDLIDREEESFRTDLISNALRELTPRQKEAIYLRFNKELEYSKIAEIMNISVEACRNLISKAITILKKQIHQK